MSNAGRVWRKINPVAYGWNCRPTPFGLPKVEHPTTFEGHVTPKEDEYQKSVRLKCRLSWSWSIMIHH